MVDAHPLSTCSRVFDSLNSAIRRNNKQHGCAKFGEMAFGFKLSVITSSDADATPILGTSWQQTLPLGPAKVESRLRTISEHVYSKQQTALTCVCLIARTGPLRTGVGARWQ